MSCYTYYKLFHRTEKHHTYNLFEKENAARLFLVSKKLYNVYTKTTVQGAGKTKQPKHVPERT